MHMSLVPTLHYFFNKCKEPIIDILLCPLASDQPEKIFSDILNTLEWILQQHGISQLWHYLDDYITAGGAGLDECQQNCQIISSMCKL